MALRFLYKKPISIDSGYLFVSCVQDYDKFSSQSYECLPALSAVEGKKFIETYNVFVRDSVALNTDNKFFSMTPFANLNTWQSSFYQGAESFARLSQMQNGDVYFFSPEWFLWSCKQLKFDADFYDICRARFDLLLLPLLRLFAVYQGLRFMQARRVPRQHLPNNLRLFITSVWTKTGYKSWKEQGFEPFYGVLPARFQERGDKIAMIYHAEGLTESVANNGNIPAFNFTSLLRVCDWIDIAWCLLFFKIKLPQQEKFPRAALYRDVSQSLSNQLPLAMVSYKATINMAHANPRANFLSLYEGNCWERGVALAVGDVDKRLICYQHTAFAPASLKMKNHLSENILASGAESVRILVKIMGHLPEKVVAGVSLRHKISPENTPFNNKGKILVLLQGAPDDALFLHVLMKHLPGHDVIVRSHPAWPVKYSTSYVLSENDLSHDLASARLVLYTGTTASFDALLAGVAVVHVDLGYSLSTDPLFALNDCPVKKTWSAGGDLALIMSALDNLSAMDRAQGFVVAHQYIRSYFAPADQTSIESIMNQVLHG